MNAWPALQTLTVCGWALRFAGCCTKRANSANALYPSAAFPEVKSTAEKFYAQKGLPTIFRITPLAPPEADAILHDAGYSAFDPSIVMTAAIPDGEDVGGVRIESAPSHEWLEGFAQANGVEECRKPIHEAILRSIVPPAAFAAVRVEARPIGFGLAVYERGMIGLFDVVVAPDARGRGHGRTLTLALLSWGRGIGARAAYLQVRAVNEPALKLYHRLGFAEAYRYHYRVPPGRGAA